MCGIFGYVAKDGGPSVDIQILSNIAKDCASRGGHSWGLSQVVGDSILTHKQPGDVRGALDRIRWAEGAIAVIGHTRHSTSGHWSNNNNNQPIQFLASDGPSDKHPIQFSVAHNGSFDNYDEIRKGLSLATECDSEIIGANIARMLSGSVGFAEALVASTKLMHRKTTQSTYTSTSGSKVEKTELVHQAPYSVLLLTKNLVYAERHSNPLHYWDTGTGVYFSSLRITTMEAPGHSIDDRETPEDDWFAWPVMKDTRCPKEVLSKAPPQPSAEEVAVMVCLGNLTNSGYSVANNQSVVKEFRKRRAQRAFMCKLYESVYETAYDGTKDSKSRKEMLAMLNALSKSDPQFFGVIRESLKRYPSESMYTGEFA